MLTKEDIGFIAGKIWHYLHSKNDFVDILELKFNLELTNTELYLGIGWLAREDKLVFYIDGNKLKIKLK